MAFQDANKESGIPADAPFRVGVSNVDQAGAVEKGFTLPWASDPLASWVYYDCSIRVVLDSGIVVHTPLPQSDPDSDTLASAVLTDPAMDTIVDLGVNLRSRDTYRDIKQRMAHSRYWFNLVGQALRIGYQIPIPSIRSVGGVPVVPHDSNPQRAHNRPVPGANFGGVVLWHAQWSLWYTTLVPPTTSTIPVADPSAHVPDFVPPADIQAPYSLGDENAQQAKPPGIITRA